MSVKASIPKFGFALALIGFSLNVGEKVSIYSVAAILLVIGFIILIENTNSNKTWKRVVSALKEYDVTYLAFGFGLLSLAKPLIEGPQILFGLIILISGLMFAGIGIGESIGKGGRILLDQNIIAGIVIGGLGFVGGTTWFAINLINATNSTFLEKSNISLQPLLVMFFGVLLISFGWKRLKNRT